ncbi:MAG: hypothetical protein ACLPOO_03840 [Terriglobales bacterium]
MQEKPLRLDVQLRRHREEVIKRRKAEQDIEAQLAAMEAELRGQTASQTPQLEPEAQEMAAD